MQGSYQEKDVTLLLKDITGLVIPLSTAERERMIQNGTHYSEMLPLEYEPSDEYMDIYKSAVENYSATTAQAVLSVAHKIWLEKNGKLVLVSLARAGTSIGILIKRAIKFIYGVEVPHYSISIIRGKGIDENAIKYILTRHSAENIQFVDGWTGKGAIRNTLQEALKGINVKPSLAVLSDPAYVADLCGTHEDFLIASSCLNATVSGLISRTFYRPDIIGKDDFHGVAYYRELIDQDMTYHFINSVENYFRTVPEWPEEQEMCQRAKVLDEIQRIQADFAIADINLIKPSIGEATRVLLRRLPWKILVYSLKDEKRLGHLYQLAKEKNVELLEYPLKYYRACGLIRSLSDA